MSTATAANTLAAQLVETDVLDAGQAEEIGASADTVVAAVRKGRTLLRLGDAAGARSQLDALAADLALLSTFLERKR